MLDEALKVLSYWRAALADSQLGRGAFSASQVRGLNGRGITLEQLRTQKVETDESWLSSAHEQAATLSENDVEAWFQGSDGDWVRCVVYPYVYLRASCHQHGAKIRSLAPEMYAPVSFIVLINRQGEILSHGRPGVSRELLEPSHAGQPLILGSVGELDEFFDREAFPDWLDEQEPVAAERWPLGKVLEYCEKILDEVVTVSLNEPLIDDTEARYSLTEQGLIHKAQQISTAVRPLIETYDAALNLNKLNSVFRTVALGKPGTAKCESKRQRKASFERGRVLGSDQKEAIEKALSAPIGSATSISGPPGTGKTIILQDLVANLLVNAALEARDPSLVVVASTNNQAVTNVLDSFGRVDHKELGILGGRWIDAPESLGVFIASHKRSESARREGYLIPDEIDEYESSLDVSEQEQKFLGHAVKCIPGVRPEHGIESAIEAIRAMLKDIVGVADQLCKVANDFRSLKSKTAFRRFRKHLSSLNQKVVRYAGVPLTTGVPEFKRLIELLAEYDRASERHSKNITNAKRAHASYLEAVEQMPAWISKFRNYPVLKTIVVAHETKTLGSNVATKAVTDKRLKQINSEFYQTVSSIQKDELVEALVPAIDQFVDSMLRPTLFMLALRYFEGRWLKEVKATLKAGDVDKRSYVKTERKWRRRSKLHPCLVSTLHSLPRHLTYWDQLAGQELPAFDFLDWLIVDEAGQVSVDVAGPSLVLSKRLLAVGDETQIEPVWSISEQIDVGNLASTGMIDASCDVDSQFGVLNKKGITASRGNLISAVKASEKTSIMLTGHRRCVPDIIQFCNDLCYGGKLEPLRTEKQSAIPAVGYWHVPGVCVRAGGSRKNEIEAAAIASLVGEKKDVWMAECDQDRLKDTLAIVTPFRQQAVAIRKALKSVLGADSESVTVGTIHSLQGAQRPVILFSPTYSAHQISKIFFDETPNMLNVAVSRAQDHFVVIGDLDVLRCSSGPANALFRHIHSVGKPYAGAFDSEVILSAMESHWGERPGHKLSGIDEHTDFLAEVLKRTDLLELMIVTPLLTPDALRIHGNELLRRVQSGTRIEIVTSRQLNYGGEWSEMFARGCELLQSKGVMIRIVDSLTHGALFIDRDREWLITDGSWLGIDESKAFVRNAEYFKEPQSVRLSTDNLASEHRRYRSGIGLEYIRD